MTGSAFGSPARRVAVAVGPAVLLLAGLGFAGAMHPGAAVAVAVAAVVGAFWLVRPPPPPDAVAKPPPAPSPATLQAVLEGIPDPLIVLNGAREIIAVNGAASESFGIGSLGRDLALSLRHPEVLAAVETAVAGGSSSTTEITLPAPVPRTFALHVAVLGEENGPGSAPAAAPRVVLVLRDETRAKRAERSRADFVTNASHELRSPLSALIGFIETLRGPASEDVAARERFLTIMQSEAQRMARLVEDLMSLSRVEINEHVLPRHRVGVADVLAAVADALAGRAEKRQMTIRLTCPADLPPVLGEADQLTQVFHNLVDNALKYGRAGTTVEIVAAFVERMPGTPSGALRIAISDAGDGIDTLHLPRLTERFYRADAGRSRRLGGTGLGLAIVKHIVNRHRGQLTISSRIGEGSTFTVFLPALAPPVGDARQGVGGPADVIKP